MSDYGVKVKGLDEVRRKLSKADANAALVVGLEWGTKKLVQEMRYPPTNEGNYPQTTVTGGATSIRWYERGTGSKRMRADGSVATRRSSHPLKDAWKTKLFKGNAPKGVVTNSATDQVSKRGYARYVIGGEKDQATIHGQRGWKRLPEEGKKLAPKITDIIVKAFKKRLK